MNEAVRAKEKILADLIALANPHDPERAHLEADELLVEFVRSLGHDDIADAFEDIGPKWYA